MKQFSNLFPIILFFLLSLVIVFPLLAPGYILTMDIAFTPKLPLPALTSSTFFFGSLLWLLNLFIPSYVLQKIMLLLVFFLAGWGMYRLVSKRYGLFGIFGGIFYAVNPFVYGRVMAGQWQLLLGYSILPFVVSAIMDFFDNPKIKNTIILGIWTLLLINLVVHFSLLIMVMIIIYGAVYAYLNQEKISLIIKQLAAFSVIAVVLNINWLLPTFLGISGVSQAITSFDFSDLVAFQSVPDKNFGLVFNLLSGYGFWPEAYDYFIVAKNIIFFWPILAILFLGLSIWGFIKMSQEEEKSNFAQLLTLSILFLLSLDLAGGVALKSFANFTYQLYDIFPPLRGFREPQKLVGIVMFCYAYFGSIGLTSLLAKVKKGSMFPSTSLGAGFVLSSLFLILPFIYTPTVFGGFWGQLKPVFYPNSWYEVNKILKNDKDTFLTLFFPWHQYTRFRFANNRVVANPAPYFFDKPVISSQNYETIPLDTHDIRTESLHVEGLLSIEKQGVNLLGEEVEEKSPWGQSLSPINVKYIILAKDDDWKRYKFLDEQTDLAKVSENDDLVLYQNLKWGVEEPIPTEQQ